MFLPVEVFYVIFGLIVVVLALFGIRKLSKLGITKIRQRAKDRVSRAKLRKGLRAKKKLSDEHLILIGDLWANYRIATAGREFRAEVIDAQIDELTTMVSDEVGFLYEMIEPPMRMTDRFASREIRYNRDGHLDIIERGDRFLWNTLVKPISLAPRRLRHRIFRPKMTGELKTLRKMQKRVTKLLHNQSHLIGALEYATTPSIPGGAAGDMTPIEFRDKMLQGQRTAAVTRENSARMQQMLNAAKARMDMTVNFLKAKEEGGEPMTADIRYITFEAVDIFGKEAIAEAIELEESGHDTEELIRAIDAGVVVLMEEYPFWAGEVREVQNFMDEILALHDELREGYDKSVFTKEDESEALRLFQVDVPAAWAEANWETMPAALNRIEKILKDAEWAIRAELERSARGSDERIALMNPVEARKKEQAEAETNGMPSEEEPTILAEEERIFTRGRQIRTESGVLMDPSLEEAWRGSDDGAKQ